jgi:hypothetical protein
MSYSQKQLIELFKTGTIPGETGIPVHIETVISNVFIFENNVYKFYKNDNNYFNSHFTDLSEKENRFLFTHEDFAWNQASTPSIYKELDGIRMSGTGIEFVIEAEADELVIVMNKVDTKDVLFERLMQNTVTKEESYSIGKSLGESLERVRMEKISGRNYFEMFKDRIADARAWIASTEKEITPDEAAQYSDYLEYIRSGQRDIFAELSDHLAYGGDVHSHNALFANGEFFLMDTYSPKRDWLVEYHGTPVYRIATDMWSLTGDRALFEACLEGYEIGSGRKLQRDTNIESMYVIYCLIIAVPYLYMLQYTDETKKIAADRTHAFLREQYALLTQRNRV